jgi:hypothetical protein
MSAWKNIDYRMIETYTLPQILRNFAQTDGGVGTNARLLVVGRARQEL